MEITKETWLTILSVALSAISSCMASGCGPKAASMEQWDQKVQTSVQAAKELGAKTEARLEIGPVSGAEGSIDVSFEPGEVTEKDLLQLVMNQQNIELARLGAVQQYDDALMKEVKSLVPDETVAELQKAFTPWGLRNLWLPQAKQARQFKAQTQPAPESQPTNVQAE